MTEPNIPLLEADLAYLEAHPEQHNQSIYINDCGTAYCLAGYRALQEAQTHQWQRRREGHGAHFSSFVVNNGESLHSREIATEAYGITVEQASFLFDGANTLERMKVMVKNLANGDHIASYLPSRD